MWGSDSYDMIHNCLNVFWKTVNVVTDGFVYTKIKVFFCTSFLVGDQGIFVDGPRALFIFLIGWALKVFFEGCYLLFGWLFVRGVSFLSFFPWAAFAAPLSNICPFYLSKKKML